MEEDGFKIPSSLLKQLDECSFGGFVLFSFDSKGNPQVHSKSDNSLNAMAVQGFISDWSKAMNRISVDNTTEILKNEINDEDIAEEDSQWDESFLDDDEEEF
mgnify:FL=1